ncbi:RteC domain-containing protein [Sphingobacterium phlebotomi]|nr:RteC domain-containing protein [Sphingobacterium phlebotomi]
MKNFVELLNREMQLRIQEVATSGITGFEYFSTCYKVVKRDLIRLKDFISHYKFKNQDEEIAFFKEIKPQFESKLFYFVELVQIELHKPLAIDKKESIKYYKSIHKHYQRLIQWNVGFLQYIRSGLTTNDNILFVRSTDYDTIFHTELFDHEDKFTTPASTELAKIVAYEEVIRDLAERIKHLKSGNGKQFPIPNHSLVWTGTKVALIELAYSLQASTSINMGQADIKQVVSALEYIFNIDVGNYYRVFQNIRIRQSGRTLFLDELKAKLIAKMDDNDEKGVKT